MSLCRKLCLLVIPLILIGCGRPNAGANKTSINAYEIAPSGTDKPTITLEHDGKKYVVFAKPVLTRNDIYHVDVLTDERLSPGHRTLLFHLTNISASKIADLTMRNLKKPLPVTVDGKMFSAPTIVAPIRTSQFRVSGPMSQAMADRIASEK